MLRALFLIVLTAIGCQCDQLLSEVVQTDNKVTSNLYRELANSQAGSLVFSGLSSDLVLSLLANGAKGDTKEELVLGLNLIRNDDERNNGYKQLTSSLNSNNKQLQLLSANKLYPAENFPILESFKSIAVNNYQAEVENLSYKNKEQAADSINKWVEKQTNNKIQNLINPNQLTPETKLVLVNTLYFSGLWLRPFSITKKGLFTSSPTESKQIDFLEGILEAKYRHCGYYQAKFLELDFKGGNVSMTFVLPNNKTGLRKLEDDWAGVTEVHDMRSGKADIIIPKYRIDTKIELVPIFKKLGIQKLFSDEADLSGLSSVKNLKVSSVLQKTFIDVNESGVEAAAATGVSIDPQILPEPEFTFHADYPFLYYIREKNTGAILFGGRYEG